MPRQGKPPPEVPIPLDELDVAEKFQVPNPLNTNAGPIDMSIMYGVRLVDGSERIGCAVCDLTFVKPHAVFQHKRKHNPPGPERFEEEEAVDEPEPEVPATPVGPPRFSDVRLDGPLDERLVLADQLLAGIMRGLVAERDKALADVEPLRQRERELLAEIKRLTAANRVLERELAPFKRLVERAASKIAASQESNDG